MSSKRSIDLNWMVPDAKCWVEIPEQEKSSEAFRSALLQSLDLTKTKAKVKYISDSKPSEEVRIERLMERSEERKSGVEDMVDLECLNDAELLINLQRRFENKQIFTYVGPTLLVVNPYEQIPGVFAEETLKKYQQYVFQPQMQMKDLPPHVWSITGEAYRSLFEMERNQALVISGESGAGKTENTKYAMKYLTSLGKIETRRSSVRKSMVKDLQNNLGGNEGSIGIEEKILSCNPILEAFGNAKTVRNDNSSRFGKYVRLLVNKKNRLILGARMDNYLLEKSRITSQGKGERNYHIFYHLLKGASIEELEAVSLSLNKKPLEMSSFEYLNKSECYDVPNIKDDVLYKEVKESFTTMKFSASEIHAIWAIVASVLHVGNVVIDDSTFDNDKPCCLKNEDGLKTAAKLLGIEYAMLEKSFLLRTREVGKQVIESPMSKADCEFARETLAKDLYEKLFIWLVKKLNFTIMPKEDLQSHVDLASLESSRFAIGLLDIFGFEVLKINSLEQFCINYTNEKLQQLYISYVFKAEEKEFINEGLEKFIVELNFKDNQPVIDLLDLYPLGIYHLLDESCAVSGTDDNLIQKIKNTHKSNPRFQFPKLSSTTFIIIHTAKNVEYTITGFRAKNKDEMSKLMLDTLISSSMADFVKIFKGLTGLEEKSEGNKEPVSKKATDKYLGAKFRMQMKDLMNELTSCDCHFIRCIKPNEQKQKGLWVPILSLTQIRYLGVLDSIKVRKDSYPARRAYRLFYQKYGDMDCLKDSIPKLVEMKADFKEITKNMFKNLFPELGTDLVLFGKTKIFMRTPALNIIESKFNEKMEQKNIVARKFQKAYYRFKKRKQLKKVMNGIRRIQDFWHCRAEYQNFQRTRKKIRLIQNFLHKKYVKQQSRNYRQLCIVIQKYFRRYIDYKNFLLSKFYILTIQRLGRGYLARKRVRKIRLCREIVLQCMIFPAWKTILYQRAVKIQKVARGYIAKSRNYKIVCQARRARQFLVQNKAVRKIQKVGRGYIIRQRLHRLNRAAFFIQGYLRMKWLSSLIKRMRKACKIIQRNVRIFINRKKAIKTRINSFLIKHTENFDDMIKNEKFYLFQTSDSKNSESYTLNTVKEIAPYDQKISLFTYLFDIDFMVDTSEVYDSLWSVNFNNTIKELLQMDMDIQWLQVGYAHTLAITSDPHRIYTWGWNDCNQLGRENYNGTQHGQVHLPFTGLKLKTASCGEDHNYVLDYENNLWCWGLNNKGQLGLGHKKNVEFPLKAEIFPKSLHIKEIKTRYHTSAMVTECGRAFVWPFPKPSSTDFHLHPTELSFPFKTPLSSVSCGFNFLCFLTSNGLLYSLGSENTHGQLGHGDTVPRSNPTLIESLKNAGEKLTSIDCGFAHCIAKSSLGKVYSWGWGENGQLGHGKLLNELSPKMVSFGPVKSRIMQVVAGFKCSLALLETKKILWWGSNGTIKASCAPKEVLLKEKNRELGNGEILPVRIASSWSRTISVLYVTLADTRASNLSQPAKMKTLNTLHYKWGESSLAEIEPPFIESISKHFSAKNMKLKRNVSQLKIQPKYPQNFLVSNPTFVEQTEVVVSENDENYDQYDENSYPFKQGINNEASKRSLMYESPDFVQKGSSGNHNQKMVSSFDPEYSENEIKVKEFSHKGFPEESSSSSEKDLNKPLRSSLKDGILKSSKEENIVKEKQRSNSKVSFIIKDELDNRNDLNFGSKTRFPSDNEVKVSKENQSKVPPMNEEMEKKLRTIKAKFNAIMQKPQIEWTEVDIQFYKIATEAKMKALLAQIN